MKPIEVATHPMFGAFVQYLLDHERYDSADVRRVVEKPWNWQPEFIVFLCRRRDQRRRL